VNHSGKGEGRRCEPKSTSLLVADVLKKVAKIERFSRSQHGGINTNIRNPLSPHWRRWTKPANPKNDPTVETRNRCLVPATSFSEYDDKPNPRSLKNPDGSPHPMAGKKDVVWFALDKSRPLFSFAGIWTD
jgi:putative SOS response-associated peptidase YedK